MKSLENQPPVSLAGKFLIAHPQMGDGRFHHAVIYMCMHDADHAMGLVINRPKGNLRLSDLLEQMGIDGPLNLADRPVMEGGPVEKDRGFVLHSPDMFVPDASIHIEPDIVLTTTRDILESLTTQNAPARAVLALGYAGWGAGQLENELSENVWLLSEGLPHLIFNDDPGRTWEQALAMTGITPANLSSESGSA